MPTRGLQILATVLNCRGTVWLAVLPFCLVNCAILWAVELVDISFPASGHGLMTLIISFLVVSKVSWSYDRYMKARHGLGQAFCSLRELNQTCLGYTLGLDQDAMRWREEATSKMIALIDCTVDTLKDQETATYLARNVTLNPNTPKYDPMNHVQALRLHLYKGSIFAFHGKLHLIERIRLVDLLNNYVANYKVLLALASTPIPFPLIQMARTFLFLYTFTIPFMMRGVAEDILLAILFVFFLTYGFIGLEIVATKLMFPFGDGSHGLGITGLRDAVIRGITSDIALVGESTAFLGNNNHHKGGSSIDFDASLYAGMGMDDVETVGTDEAGSSIYIPMV
ncbi:unnamed protein product [Cylindrotheca closterium]|uniref:Uncharacterized protein n=1 Tax=Cylindrotheca closterium TaxID=2856 RepID=A0AAD2FZU3_9STRA|nr:unnamed protein product [Cylindrotheca closterium]